MNPLVITTMALASVSLVKERNFIKDNWKPILGVGTTLGVTFVVWTIYKDFKKNNIPGGLEEDERFEPSVITNAQALIRADRLYNAMRTFGKPNQDEITEIRSVLSGLAYNDFILISKEFAERRYVIATGVGGIWPADKRNLVFWLTNELPLQDLNDLKKALPNVF